MTATTAAQKKMKRKRKKLKSRRAKGTKLASILKGRVASHRSILTSQAYITRLIYILT